MAALSVRQPFVTNMEMELNEMQEDKALKKFSQLRSTTDFWPQVSQSK